MLFCDGFEKDARLSWNGDVVVEIIKIRNLNYWLQNLTITHKPTLCSIFHHYIHIAFYFMPKEHVVSSSSIVYKCPALISISPKQTATIHFMLLKHEELDPKQNRREKRRAPTSK